MLKPDSAGVRRGRWQLADTWIPFAAEQLPVGGEGTGRLVTVRVQSPSRAYLSDRGTLVSRVPMPIALTNLAGVVHLRAGYVRVTVYGSVAAVLSVGAMASIFIVGGAQFFLSVPTLGTAVVGLGLMAAGGWLLKQLPGVGREVADDAARVLELMIRAEEETGVQLVPR